MTRVAFKLCGIPVNEPIRSLRDSALGWKAAIRSGIKPSTIRLDTNRTRKGYALSACDDAFARYLYSNE
jgi:hypothetical protein